jgi:hypothetical protein
MLVSYVQQGGGVPVAEAPFSDKSVDMANTTYLICFDELPSESLLLRQADLCTECWTAYVQSVATSGHSAVIACPSHKCRGSIGLFDIPHIVFGARATIPCTMQKLFTPLWSGMMPNDFAFKRRAPATALRRVVTNCCSR